MKKFFALLVAALILASVSACSSGVPQEEYNRVVEERNMLKEDVEKLNLKVDELENTAVYEEYGTSEKYKVWAGDMHAYLIEILNDIDNGKSGVADRMVEIKAYFGELCAYSIVYSQANKEVIAAGMADIQDLTVEQKMNMVELVTDVTNSVIVKVSEVLSEQILFYDDAASGAMSATDFVHETRTNIDEIYNIIFAE